MEVQILAPLTALETSLNSLLTSLTTTSHFANAPRATHDLLAADDALTAPLTNLKRHQDNYTHITALRLEAARLQDQLKDTVRTCVELRSQITEILPSIWDEEDSDDDDDEQDTDAKRNEVDYDTLLAFAARIGKHNTAAAREAERDSDRRRVETNEKKSRRALSEVNGTAALADQGTSEHTATDESAAALAGVNDALAFQRASMGMAFPPPDRLRMGLLGQLQLLREQQGEQAVEAEIERLVRASEGVAGDDDEMKDDTVSAEPTRPDPAAPATTQTQPSAPPPQTAPPPPKVKPVSLDFDDSDED